MELFYAYKIEDGLVRMDAEESAHCVRVLRHKTGDGISVIAGNSPTAIYHCVITDDSPKGAVARVVSVQEGWGGHPYYLRMAVCPTKNIDRYEWFVEKAVELGVDEIVPVIGEHSERRVVRLDRLEKIAVAAAKQSLKGRVPAIAEPVSVRDFIASCLSGSSSCLSGSSPCHSERSERISDTCHSERSEGISDTRLIAYCSDDVAPRGSIFDALAAAVPSAAGKELVCAPDVETPSQAAAQVTVLIGPEGDFSKEEVRAALDAGFIPVHLGPSRLRTETAAITAVEAVYFSLGLVAPAYDSAPSARHLTP